MENFLKLVNLVGTLRGNKGCPWDKKQTLDSFKTYILEEVYEVIDAIEKKNYSYLKEELGDLLFHIVFIAQICNELNLFSIKEIIESTYTKMYNRHPHVFNKDTYEDKPIEKKWEEIKKDEKEEYSLLSNIPSIIPALLRAYIISQRVARIGFDWPNVEEIHTKIEEELEELRSAEKSAETHRIREEIGDLLFTIVNLARFHSIDPEDALRFSSDKFIKRFAYIEKNIDIQHSTLNKMDALWNEIKDIEKKGE